MQLQPSALSMQPGSMLTMDTVTIVSSCDAVASYAVAACARGADLDEYQGGRGWVLVRSLYQQLNGTSLNATHVNITCESGAVFAPCTAATALNGDGLVSAIQASSNASSLINTTAYITLTGDASLAEVGTTTMNVNGYTLAIRGSNTASSPPALNMGAQSSIIRLIQASNSTSSSAASTSPSILRLEGLVLHNLPPGPSSLYPYSLLTVLLWSVGATRSFGASTGTSASSQQTTTTTLLSLANCTLVVPDEELQMWGSWFNVLSTAASASASSSAAGAPQAWLLNTIASQAQASSWAWAPGSASSRLARLTISTMIGLNATWAMQNVTIHSARYALYGQSLFAYDSEDVSPASYALALGRQLSVDEYDAFPTLQAIRTPATLAPASFAPALAAVNTTSGSRQYRVLLVNHTQVNKAGWSASPVALASGDRALIVGDPVSPSRVHLDLNWTASGISSLTDAQPLTTNYAQLDSLVVLNPGPLPAEQFNSAPSGSSFGLTPLTSTERAALCNITSALWFFNLSASADPYNSARPIDRPLLFRNVTFVLPSLEIEVISSIIATGTTDRNIPILLEQLLARRLSGSTKGVTVDSDGYGSSIFFERLVHFQYVGYDVTLVPMSLFSKKYPASFKLIGYPAPALTLILTSFTDKKPPSASPPPVVNTSGGLEPLATSPPMAVGTADPPKAPPSPLSPPPLPSGASDAESGPLPSPPTDTSTSAETRTPSIVGGVVGACVGGAVVVVLLTLVWARLKRLHPEEQQKQQPPGTDNTQPMSQSSDMEAASGSLQQSSKPSYGPMSSSRGASGINGSSPASTNVGKGSSRSVPSGAGSRESGTCKPAWASSGEMGIVWLGGEEDRGGDARAQVIIWAPAEPADDEHVVIEQQGSNITTGSASHAVHPLPPEPAMLGRDQRHDRDNPYQRQHDHQLHQSRPQSMMRPSSSYAVRASFRQQKPEEAGRKTGAITDALLAVPETSTSGSKQQHELQQAQVEDDGTSEAEAHQRGLVKDMCQALSVMQCGGGDVMADLDVEGLLGKGSYGTVFHGTWKGLPVAIKRLTFQQVAHPDGRPSTMQQHIMQEAAINASLKHENVVATYGFGLRPLSLGTRKKFHHEGRPGSGGVVQDWLLFLIQELCVEGSLYQAILESRFFDKQARQPLMPQVIKICIDIFTGLRHIHERRLVHADVKPDNILLALVAGPVPNSNAASKQGAGQPQASQQQPRRQMLVAKLADFGLSVLINAEGSHASGVKHGTPLYIAPEIMDAQQASGASDVYAAGVVMWELYHGRSAWSHLVEMTKAGFPVPRNVHYVPNLFTFNEHHTLPEFEDLICACLTLRRHQRPTADDCIKALEKMMANLMKENWDSWRQAV